MYHRRCIGCGERTQLKYPNRFKQDTRKFCTMRCAARKGAEAVEYSCWCAACDEWHDETAARLCLEERLRADAARKLDARAKRIFGCAECGGTGPCKNRPCAHLHDDTMVCEKCDVHNEGV